MYLKEIWILLYLTWNLSESNLKYIYFYINISVEHLDFSLIIYIYIYASIHTHTHIYIPLIKQTTREIFVLNENSLKKNSQI